MDTLKLKEQVEIIRQAFGYINQFKNETFIIKIDSALIGHSLFPILIKDLVLLHSMGIRIVLVPGAKTRIDEVLTTYGIKSKMVDGVRVSSPEAIPFIKMAAFDVSNKIMTMLAESGAHAVIGNWVRARSIGVRNGVDFQSSGLVDKLHVNILKNVLDDGLIPIFPNIGWSAKGKPYNVSSSELAFTLATELQAAKLFFVTDHNGLSSKGYRLPAGVYVSNDGVISQLTTAQAGNFIDLNTKAAHDEQFDLVSLAYQACNKGVRRVHIVNGLVEGMILQEIFSNRGLGTMIYSNQHENIRSMTAADIPEVLRIMQPAIEDMIILPRTATDLEEKLEEYAVYEVDGTVHACGALHVFGNGQGEIAAIVVDEMYGKLGIGGKMIQYLIERATAMKLKEVFVLTTQTSDWFSQLGFVKAGIKDLPKEKSQDYNRKRNSLVLRYKLSKHRTKRALIVD
jgi:amino-acid N-acetyltransferase